MLTKVKAERNADKTINITWEVQNELNVTGYSIERSKDGITFLPLADKSALQNNGSNVIYTHNDANPLSSDNYYRIKVSGKNGEPLYSDIVKVESLKIPPSISVYPNPVTNKKMNLVFVNEPAGTYQLELTNKLGQVMYTGKVAIDGVNITRKVSLIYVQAAGLYRLKIKLPDGTISTQQLMIE